MGRRRRDGQAPSREELVESAGGVATASRTGSGNIGEHLLSLQQTHGNRAVTTIVQRKGSKGGKAAVKGKGSGKPKVVSYFPEYDSSLQGTPGEMRSAGLSMIASDDPGRIRRGIHFYEQAYLRTDGKDHRSDGNILYNGYKKLGKTEQAAWWQGVSNGTIKPFAAEDQTGKGH